MNVPIPDQSGHHKPAPDDLAGTPVCKEEDNPTIHVGDVPGGGGKKAHGSPTSPPQALPTPDDLAGIPVSAEGVEDVKLHSRKPRA
jgi:hypothetical protein